MKIRLAVCTLVTGVCLFANQRGISDPQVQSALKQLQSSNWSDRSAGFYAIVKAGLKTDQDSVPVPDGILAVSRADPASRSGLVQALNRLLDIETTLVNEARAPVSEAYSDYYGDLIQAVAVLRDSSSTHVLLRCVNTGGMAINALAGFGDRALSEALNILPGADEETRRNLIEVFASMAEPKNIERLSAPDSRSLLLNALLTGANDTNPYSRAIAAQGLVHFSAPEAVQTLKRLAASDPFTVEANDAPRFLVREAATKALHKQGTVER